MKRSKVSGIIIGIIGDLHLTGSLPYTVLGSDIRKKKTMQFLRDFYSKAKEMDVKLVLVSGDLCHESRLDNDALDMLEHFLSISRIYKIPTVMINGNHDMDGPKSILRFLRWRHKTDPQIFSYPDSEAFVSSFLYNKIKLVSINYVPDFRFLSLADELKIKSDSFKILLAHIGIKGTLHGSTKSIVGILPEDIDKISKYYDLMVFGHHHDFQVVGSNGFYTGSICQTRMDERNSIPGGSFINLSNMEVVRFENKISPRFTIIEGYEINPSDIKGNIVKVILDLEGKTEEENRNFIDEINLNEPYFLIPPRIKRTFKFKGEDKDYSLSSEKIKNFSRKDKINLLSQVSDRVGGKFTIERKNYLKEQVINIYNGVLGGDRI